MVVALHDFNHPWLERLPLVPARMDRAFFQCFVDSALTDVNS